MISDCLIIFVFFFYTLQCEFIIKANFVWNKAISLLFYICNVILRKAVLALTPEYYMLNWKAAKTNFIVFVWPDRGLTTIYHTQGEHASLTWQGLDYDLPHSRWTCQLDLTGAWLRSTTLKVNMPAWPDRGLTTIYHSRWTCQLDYDLPHSRWTCQLDLTGAWLWSTNWGEHASLTTIYHTQGEHASLTWQGLDYDLPLEVNMPAWPDRGLTTIYHTRGEHASLTTIYHTRGEHASLTWQGLD
jgi:hypothetical protein